MYKFNQIIKGAELPLLTYFKWFLKITVADTMTVRTPDVFSPLGQLGLAGTVRRVRRHRRRLDRLRLRLQSF